ncbi:MAG: hypothetical protein AAB214_18845 [Fibrobacterota bacterium]
MNSTTLKAERTKVKSKRVVTIPPGAEAVKITSTLARAFIGARCCFTGIDEDSTSHNATIVDADTLVAKVKCSDGVFFAQWEDVAVYTPDIIARIPNLALA